MTTLLADDPIAVRLVAAIHAGDVDELRRLTVAHSDLAELWVVGADGTWRSPLHLATDWPGHFPRVAETIRLLVGAGADVTVRVRHCASHAETPLHWAASTDDVAALDALIDAGADLEADGAVIGGRTAVSDAAAFGQWATAARLVQRGARTTLWESATLGLADRVETALAADPPPTPQEITHSFWGACHGGRLTIAQRLHALGAEVNWVGWDGLTPLVAARRGGFAAVAAWLVDVGGTAG